LSRKRKLVSKDGAVALDEKFHSTLTLGYGGGEGFPRLSGGWWQSCEAAGGSRPKSGREEKIGGLGGSADLVGQPVKSWQRVDRGEEFSKRIVFVTSGEGQKGEEAGLKRAQRPIGNGLLGKDFDVSSYGGSEGAGIDEMCGEKEDGFERLASGALGGKKRW
jgi:hypothetical protein